MANIQDRLTALEIEFKQLEDEMAEVKKELTYYRRIGIKTGAVGICLLSLGAGATMTADKLKEKIVAILAWLFT